MWSVKRGRFISEGHYDLEDAIDCAKAMARKNESVVVDMTKKQVRLLKSWTI